MPLAAGWPLTGEMSVMCSVVLLTHSANYSTHTEIWNRTGQTTCQAIHFLKSFSVVHCFIRKFLSLEEMLIRTQKGVQTLELCSYSFFSTIADSLHNPKLTAQNIFPRIKLWWSTKKKKSVCNRNIYQYVLQQHFSLLNIFLWEFSSRQNPKSEQQEFLKMDSANKCRTGSWSQQPHLGAGFRILLLKLLAIACTIWVTAHANNLSSRNFHVN